ncbi:MAG: universal stress protein [Pseudomonadota bacterium]
MFWGKRSEAGTAEAEQPQGVPEVKKILMATDLSARSDRALDRAVQLSGEHGASLQILHIVDEDLPVSVQDKAAEVAQAEIRAALKKADPGDKSEAVITVMPGKADQDIIESANDADADLIIMGVHRNVPEGKPLVGTTVERVIRFGERPVLVAPSVVQGPCQKAMIAVDFSVFSRFAIRAALALAPCAEVYAVHAYHVPFQGFQHGRQARKDVADDHERRLAALIEEEMKAIIDVSASARRAADVKMIIRHGEVLSVLRAEADRLQPDLLVLGTHGRVGVANAMFGSIAESFLTDPFCDTLAVKAW